MPSLASVTNCTCVRLQIHTDKQVKYFKRKSDIHNNKSAYPNF